MGESKFDRQGFVELWGAADYGLCLWCAAFAHFADGILGLPNFVFIRTAGLLVQFLKAINQRRKSWEMLLAPM